MPSFKCKDIGMTCSFEVTDDNQDELMSIIALHADKSHNIKQPSPELLDKIKKAVKS